MSAPVWIAAAAHLCLLSTGAGHLPAEDGQCLYLSLQVAQALANGDTLAVALIKASLRGLLLAHVQALPDALIHKSLVARLPLPPNVCLRQALLIAPHVLVHDVAVLTPLAD